MFPTYLQTFLLGGGQQSWLSAKAVHGLTVADPHKIHREAKSIMDFSVQKSESRPDGDGAGTSWLHPGCLACHSFHCRFAPLSSLLPAGTTHTDGGGLSVPDHVVGESSGNFTEKSIFKKFPVCFC